MEISCMMQGGGGGGIIEQAVTQNLILFLSLNPLTGWGEEEGA